MHIVHVITKFDVGGAQSVVRDLAQRQKRDGHTVTVLSGSLGRVAVEAQNGGVEIRLVPTLQHSLNLRVDRECADDLAVILTSLKPNIVHCHSSKGGLLGRIASRRVQLPSIYTAHGWPFQAGASMRQRIPSALGEWVGTRRGSLVVCVTRSDLRLSNRLRITHPDATIFIPNGTGNPTPFAPRAARESKDFSLVMVARFAAPKRQDHVIAALKILPQSVRVLFVGAGSGLQRAKQLAFGDGSVSRRVEFLGETDPEPVFARADAMVMISDYEGLPMSILEGMRAGLPIIASQLPGIAEAIQHRREGLLIQDGVKGLVSAVRELVTDRSEGGTLCAELGLAARSRWEREFTAEVMHERYMNAYRSIF